MKTTCILLCLLALTILSCSENETPATNTASRATVPVRDSNDISVRIRGTWNWVQSAGGFAGIIETPASTGQNKTITFSGPHSYHIAINGVTASQGTYTLTTRYCIHFGVYKPAIDFSDPMLEDQTIENLTPWVLLFSDDYFDGFTSRYSR